MARASNSEGIVHPDAHLMAIFKELLETTKDNNDILKENQQIMLQNTKLLMNLDEKMRKLVMNTSSFR
ncbi:MAG: hypothetical protein ABI361_09390 [Nitrososphaera sp.]|jgi:hypothetical protein